MQYTAGATVMVVVVMLAHAGWVTARHRARTLPHGEFECLDSDDCGLGRCCIVRPDRYSYPSCSPHGQQGEQCRPSAQTFNTTLSYPDGLVTDVTNVHYVMCACAHHLECRRGTCVDPDSAREINSLETEE